MAAISFLKGIGAARIALIGHSSNGAVAIKSANFSTLVTALETAGPPVILLVGRFHSDHEGGTVSQIRRHHPGAEIRTISLEPACETVELNPEEPQADFVICTTP